MISLCIANRNQITHIINRHNLYLYIKNNEDNNKKIKKIKKIKKN